MKIIIYTDGGSRGNPGPSAIGVFVTNGLDKKYSEYIGEATNNEAEYQAVIFALKKLKLLLGKEKIKNAPFFQGRFFEINVLFLFPCGGTRSRAPKNLVLCFRSD